jgi:hypothetical protein
MKQNQNFPDDSQDGDIPLPILTAVQRPTVIETVGKNIQRRAARAAKPAGNPFSKSGWNDPDHAALIGF